MPKKRTSIYSKPSSPAHPSLSSSSKNSSHYLTGTAPTSNSVNDRIQQLRLEQNAVKSKPVEAPPHHTVPPSLQAILQVPDVPPPRPRPGLRVTGGRRGPAGPAPPSSWLHRKPTKQRDVRDAGPRLRTSCSLPGYDLPSPGSLLELTLRKIATDWNFHSQYDQYYLATLPVRYKELVLRYIALLSPHGIDCSSLEAMFWNETELEDATGAEDLIRLDVSTSIGRSLSLKDLKTFFTLPSLPQLGNPSSSPDKFSSADNVPEEWDTKIPTCPSLPRFHSITHLSLAHPPSNISWSTLLSTLLPHLPQALTHLSLAFWPFPTLTPNSLTAYTTTPMGTVQAGGSGFYSIYDSNWTECASIMRRVAKSTSGLQWLDLTGCWPWIEALASGGADDNAFDWAVLWTRLDTLCLGQGWVPEIFSQEPLAFSSDEEDDDDVDDDERRKKKTMRMNEVARCRKAADDGASSWVSNTALTKQERELVTWAEVELAAVGFERRLKDKIASVIASSSSSSSSSSFPSSSHHNEGGEQQQQQQGRARARARGETSTVFATPPGDILINDTNHHNDEEDEDEEEDWSAAPTLRGRGLSHNKRRSANTAAAAVAASSGRRSGIIRFERGRDAKLMREAWMEE